MQKRKDRRAHERKEMRAAKKRDEGQCRVPRCEWQKDDPRIEAAHLKEEHRGMGGNPKLDRTEQKKCIALCFIHHDQYDHGDLLIVPEDAEAIFDGICAYYERDDETGKFVHIGTDKRTAVSIAVGK